MSLSVTTYEKNIKKITFVEVRFFIIMPPPDVRRIIGSKIHALAKHVTSEQECRRLFGSNWSTKLVEGEVVSSYDGRKPGGGRANWIVVGKYIVQNREKTVQLNIRSVKKGPVTPKSPTETPIVAAAVPIAEPVVAEDNPVENGMSTFAPLSQHLPLLTLLSSVHSI